MDDRQEQIARYYEKRDRRAAGEAALERACNYLAKSIVIGMVRPDKPLGDDDVDDLTRDDTPPRR